MKCPKKNKNCSSMLSFHASKNNYICSGINNKPTKYNKDIIKLCLSGFFSKTCIEMTLDEAASIIAVLGASLSETVYNK